MVSETSAGLFVTQLDCKKRNFGKSFKTYQLEILVWCGNGKRMSLLQALLKFKHNDYSGTDP